MSWNLGIDGFGDTELELSVICDYEDACDTYRVGEQAGDGRIQFFGGCKSRGLLCLFRLVFLLLDLVLLLRLVLLFLCMRHCCCGVWG